MLQPGVTWVEPFCGSCAVGTRLPKLDRLFNDKSPFLTAMLWKKIQNPAWHPREYKKEEYLRIRDCFEQHGADMTKKVFELDDAELGWVGFAHSYNAMFFKGYRGFDWHEGKNDFVDYVQEFRSGFEATCTALSGSPGDVMITNNSFDTLHYPEDSVVYCDPPYQTAAFDDFYPEAKGFDFDLFWEWCRIQVREHHAMALYVSEYEAPKDFTQIWSMPKKIHVGGKRGSGKRRVKTERLFTFYA